MQTFRCVPCLALAVLIASAGAGTAHAQARLGGDTPGERERASCSSAFWRR